jgi:hypothetical protein
MAGIDEVRRDIKQILFAEVKNLPNAPETSFADSLNGCYSKCSIDPSKLTPEEMKLYRSQ